MDVKTLFVTTKDGETGEPLYIDTAEFTAIYGTYHEPGTANYVCDAKALQTVRNELLTTCTDVVQFAYMLCTCIDIAHALTKYPQDISDTRANIYYAELCNTFYIVNNKAMEILSIEAYAELCEQVNAMRYYINSL